MGISILINIYLVDIVGIRQRIEHSSSQVKGIHSMDGDGGRLITGKQRKYYE